MAQLNTENIPSPGSLGINTEDSGVDAPTAFAKIALNCVVSRDNRLAARKGFEALAPTSGFSGAVKQMFEVINLDGTKEFIWTTPTKVYAGYPTHTDITGALSVTGGDWQFCNLQNTVFATQRSHTPAAWRKITGTWTAQTITMPSDMSTEKPDVCLSAFGRVFAANGSNVKYKIWFSEELNPLNFTTAGAGSLDISKAMVGNDNIVALANFGNRLIILCEKQTIVYSVDTAASPFLVLEEVIKGIGCVSRDSVVNTGSDLLWLAKQGVVSLSRLTSSDGQLPIGDISANVHSLLQNAIGVTVDRNTIKACWWEAERSYLLLFPTLDTVYCFNLRVTSESGPSTTTWDTTKSMSCIMSDIDRNLYFGGTDTWLIYRGYGSNSDKYRLKYYSGFMDFKDPTSFKNLKNLSFQVKTGTEQTTSIKWAFDYSDTFEADAFVTTGIGGLASEYGIAEYGLAEFAAGPQIHDMRTVGGLSGQYLQFGLETEVQGNEYVIYNTEVHVTMGKRY